MLFTALRLRCRSILFLSLFLGMAVGPRACSADPPAVRWNLPGPAPHLLMHYMPWFQVEAGPGQSKQTWTHWRWDGPGPKHDPAQRRADGLRDVASVYYPLIGPYNTWSRAVVRYHLETIKAVGVQGLVVDWYGPDSYTDQQVPQILDEAQRVGLKVAICYEEKMNFLWRGFKTREQAIQAATIDIRHILTHYANHPAYLRCDGRPLILQFDGYGNGPMGQGFFSPAELTQILHDQPMPVAYCRQGLTPEFHPAIPGAFQWWSSTSGELLNFAHSARKMVDEQKLSFFANEISPGFDDTGVWGWGDGARVTPRAGISLLKNTFDLSFTDRPDLIQIVTWNDFNEGTVMEPTRENGFQYVDALATWWAERTGRHADLEALRKPFLNYVKTCSPEERAELPAAPYDVYLKPRPLTIEIPNYLDYLAQHPAH